jgi:non-specific protein-tyrosine kinase
MELKQYASILWRWMWLILLGTMTAGAAAYITSELTWPVYAASTTLLINQAPSDKTTDYTAILTSERLARTYVEMLTTRPVLEEAIQTLRLNMQPDDLAEAVKVTAVRDTQLITVQVENADPGLAAQLANLIPEVFTRQNETLQASRYAATKASLSQQLDALNQQIQQTQAGINATGAPNSASEQA